jgi:hypothetical protein
MAGAKDYSDDIFEKLSLVVLPDALNPSIKPNCDKASSGGLKLSRSQLKNDFKVMCEDFLLNTIYNRYHGLPPWPDLFYRRMISHQDVLSKEQIMSWITALCYYKDW